MCKYVSHVCRDTNDIFTDVVLVSQETVIGYCRPAAISRDNYRCMTSSCRILLVISSCLILMSCHFVMSYIDVMSFGHVLY